MTFVELLRRAKMDAMARPADPWRLRLERSGAMLGHDGVERISTQALFDILKCRSAAGTRLPAGDSRSSCVIRVDGNEGAKLGPERLQGPSAGLRARYARLPLILAVHLN